MEGLFSCSGVQEGIVQPIGTFIRVSTQRGFSLPQHIALPSSPSRFIFFRLPEPPPSPVGPPLSEPADGVAHCSSLRHWSPSGIPPLLFGCELSVAPALGVDQLFASYCASLYAWHISGSICSLRLPGLCLFFLPPLVACRFIASYDLLGNASIVFGVAQLAHSFWLPLVLWLPWSCRGARDFCSFGRVG